MANKVRFSLMIDESVVADAKAVGRNLSAVAENAIRFETRRSDAALGRRPAAVLSMDRPAVSTLKQAPDRYVLVLGHPGVAPVETVIAAPLFDPAAFPVAEVINPMIPVGARTLVPDTEQMSAVSIRELGLQVTTCETHEYAVANAINRLSFGI